MKRIVFLIISVLAVLASCNAPSPNTGTTVDTVNGSITIDVPAEYADKNIDKVSVEAFLVNDANLRIKRYYEEHTIQNPTEVVFSPDTYGYFDIWVNLYFEGSLVGTLMTEAALTADEYNIALLSATVPVTYTSLYLADEDLSGSPLISSAHPTIIALERSDAFDWSSLGKGMMPCPFFEDGAYQSGIRNNVEWSAMIDGLSRYVGYLHKLNSSSKFNFIFNDFDSYLLLPLAFDNGLTTSNQFSVTLISDGTGTYAPVPGFSSAAGMVLRFILRSVSGCRRKKKRGQTACAGFSACRTGTEAKTGKKRTCRVPAGRNSASFTGRNAFALPAGRNLPGQILEADSAAVFAETECARHPRGRKSQPVSGNHLCGDFPAFAFPSRPIPFDAAAAGRKNRNGAGCGFRRQKQRNDRRPLRRTGYGTPASGAGSLRKRRSAARERPSGPCKNPDAPAAYIAQTNCCCLYRSGKRGNSRQSRHKRAGIALAANRRRIYPPGRPQPGHCLFFGYGAGAPGRKPEQGFRSVCPAG